ncbi:unnamed protein product [Rotaria sordida]|uniref:Large ribosomal subunit protein eL31 n=1 Tax=Rotaria sordida TaxID=392033 RepID=A0A818T461_9BILA|nr:unnamed protein product [Rotaria sordida]CAF3674638.1 unnamed protein product [Rotaria sordida]
MANKKGKKGESGSSKKQITNEVVTREYTVNLHKRLHGIAFKKRAPRAVKELKKFAEKMMKTPDVRIDSKLNKEIWSQGINHVPYRVRVRLARQRNEDEDSPHKLYTLVTFVRVPSFKDDDSNQSRQLSSKVFRSESASLPFGIANVLQSTNESSKICQTPITTSILSVNPWLMALHHLSQSSSTTALANASNWCAKCSIQFRLTSELVHHIRVHHATRRNYHHHHQISTETITPTRKTFTNSTSSMNLTCHICYETFRERHHLTRHMTSHR